MTHSRDDDWPEFIDVPQLPEPADDLIGHRFRVGGRGSTELYRLWQDDSGEFHWSVTRPRELLTLALFDYFGFAPANDGEHGYPLTISHALQGVMNHETKLARHPGPHPRSPEREPRGGAAGLTHDHTGMVDVRLHYWGRMPAEEYYRLRGERHTDDVENDRQGTRED